MRHALIATLVLTLVLAPVSVLTNGAVADIAQDGANAVKTAIIGSVEPEPGPDPAPSVGFSSIALPTAQVDGVAWSVAAAQGLVFVGGSFSAVRAPGASPADAGVPRENFAVLDAASGLPTSCAPSFALPRRAAAATVRALEVSPDGRTLYVGGFFSHVAGVPRQHLAALDIATCTLDRTFDPLPSGIVRAVAATDEVVYYGGDFSAVGGATRLRAAAAGAVGRPSVGALLAWSPSFDDVVRAMALSPRDGVVLVGGDFQRVDGMPSHALAVLHPDTAGVVHAFRGVIPGNSDVKDLAVDASGFYTANEGKGQGVFDGRIAFRWEGYQESWRDACLGATQAVYAHNGVLYSGSHTHDCSAMGDFGEGPRYHLLAQAVSSPWLLPWFVNTNDGVGEMLGPRDLTVTTSGGVEYLWVVGEFTSVNGLPQRGLTHVAQVP